MQKSGKKVKYIIEYISYIFLIRFLRLLGLERSAGLCSYLARKIGPCLKVTEIALNNLKLLGQETDTDVIINKLWDNFGRYIGELPFVNELSEEELKARITISGLEHIEQYLKQEQPFLLCAAHQANWDFLINGLSRICPEMSVVYRPANNPYIDKAILESRQNNRNITMIPKGTVKNLLTAIKANASITILVDQKMNNGIEVPFFGKPAMTTPSIAKISLQYHYPIIPCQLVRTENSYFKMIIYPPLDYQPTGNKAKDIYQIMQKINMMLEQWIRQEPSQWFWFHNRWGKYSHENIVINKK